MNEQIDFDFRKRIISSPDGSDALNCYVCGTCTAGCPVAGLDDSYSPRTIMRMSLLGMKDSLTKSENIWKCSQCGRCTAYCPQNARPSDVIRALRTIAEEDGAVPKGTVENMEALEDEIGRLRLKRVAEANPRRGKK